MCSESQQFQTSKIIQPKHDMKTKPTSEIFLGNGSMFFIPNDQENDDDEIFDAFEAQYNETPEMKFEKELDSKIEKKGRDAAKKRCRYHSRQNAPVHPSWMSRIHQDVRETEISKLGWKGVHLKLSLNDIAIIPQVIANKTGRSNVEATGIRKQNVKISKKKMNEVKRMARNGTLGDWSGTKIKFGE